MHVSNFQACEKEYLDVIDIFSGISVTVLPSRLVMIGDGPERSAALDRAKILGVEQIKFPSWGSIRTLTNCCHVLTCIPAYQVLQNPSA